jgi:DNA-binding transcriptional ArsR family regulator
MKGAIMRSPVVQSPDAILNIPPSPRDPACGPVGLPEAHCVEDARTAAVFASPRAVQLLLALAVQPRSLGELSAHTGLALSLLHYHLKRLQALNLVQVAEVQRRAGRMVKIYRAVAKRFFVPAPLVGELPGTAMSQRLRASLDQCLVGSIEGLWWFHDTNGPRMHLARQRRSSRVSSELWLELRLSTADAHAMAEELKALMDRYKSKPPSGKGRYLVHTALAPL